MGSSLSERKKVKRLKAHLIDLLDEKGDTVYTKSKFIARRDGVDLSPREIGACMYLLSEHSEALEVEPWGYTNATTWKISRP